MIKFLMLGKNNDKNKDNEAPTNHPITMVMTKNFIIF